MCLAIDTPRRPFFLKKVSELIELVKVKYNNPPRGYISSGVEDIIQLLLAIPEPNEDFNVNDEGTNSSSQYYEYQSYNILIEACFKKIW